MSGGIERRDHALEDEDVERVIEGWTAAEVLAIHDFLQGLCERLWGRHETVLIEHLLGLDELDGPLERPARSANLELALEEPEQPF